MKVLVIDDSQNMAEVQKKLIEKYIPGSNVIAIDFPLYYQFFLDKNIDVLFVDYVMPDLNGLQIIEKFKEVNPNITCILCSGVIDLNTLKIDDSIIKVAKPITKQKILESFGVKKVSELA